MFGLDDWIVRLGGGGLMVFVVAVLLGLRHATDPDHLTAVSTLFLSDQREGPRRATALGLSWGLGHGATLFTFGLPVVLFRRYLPDSVQGAAEAAIGLLIMALAVRLLLRWRRGYFHMHPHSPHAEGLGRSHLTAWGIGMVHGIGGSAGVGVLLVGAVPVQTQGAIALLVFAGATAASMALISAAFGYALASWTVRRRLAKLVPLLGAASLLFGVWYSIGALHGLA